MITLVKDNRTFITDDPDLIRAFIQNGWETKKEETPLPIPDEKKPSTRKKSTK